MTAASLPARIAYTVLALPLGGAAGFYSCMQVLPQFTASHPHIDPHGDGSGIFKIAICAGASVALTLGLFALTLPSIRHRKRQGRGWRIGLSCLVVLLASVAIADQEFGLIFDLVFALWLTYTMAFTFVRYGVIDQVRRRHASARNY